MRRLSSFNSAPTTGQGCRSLTQIDDHIPDGTPQASHQLDFGSGWPLEMQAAQGSPLSAERSVHLHLAGFQAIRSEFLFAEVPREEASGIFALFEIDEVSTDQG